MFLLGRGPDLMAKFVCSFLLNLEELILPHNLTRRHFRQINCQSSFTVSSFKARSFMFHSLVLTLKWKSHVERTVEFTVKFIYIQYRFVSGF